MAKTREDLEREELLAKYKALSAPLDLEATPETPDVVRPLSRGGAAPDSLAEQEATPVEAPEIPGLGRLIAGIIDPKSVARTEIGDKLNIQPVAPTAPAVDPLAEKIAAQKSAIDALPPIDTSVQPDTMAELGGTPDILPTSTPLDDNVDAPSVPSSPKSDQPAKQSDKKVAPPKTVQEKQLRKVTNQLAKEGKIAPEQKKDYLEMLLQEYRDARGARKEEIETASMHDAIINATANFARMAGVEKQFLPQKESNLAGAARAEKAGELQELLNQINVEKGLKGLKPKEIDAYQQAQLNLKKDELNLKRDALSTKRSEAGSRNPISAESKLYRNQLRQMANAQYADPKAVEEMMNSIAGMSEAELKDMKFVNTIRSGDMGLTKSQIKRHSLQKELQESRTTSKEDYRKRRQDERDYNRVGRRVDKVAGTSGARSPYGRSLAKAKLTADGLRIVHDIETSNYVLDDRMVSELAMVLGSAITGGMQVPQEVVKELKADTLEGRVAKAKEWLLSRPERSLPKSFLNQYKSQLKTQNEVWSKNTKNAQGAMYNSMNDIWRRNKSAEEDFLRSVREANKMMKPGYLKTHNQNTHIEKMITKKLEREEANSDKRNLLMKETRDLMQSEGISFDEAKKIVIANSK